VDSLALYQRAMAQGISLSPGPMFSATRGFRNCIRLNYGHPWTPQLEHGTRELARLASEETNHGSHEIRD
jgi:DNA-binding transcriptional MocR family regulator